MPRKSAFEVGQMDLILRVIKNAPTISSCRVTSHGEVVCIQQSTYTDPIVIPQSLPSCTASCSWIILQSFNVIFVWIVIMPKRCVSGLCNNTNEDVTALIHGQKIPKSHASGIVLWNSTELTGSMVIPHMFCVVFTSDNLMISYLMVSGDIHLVFTPGLPRVNVPE